MKTALKDLKAYTDVQLNAGATMSYSSFALVPLLAGQYYRVKSIQALLDNAVFDETNFTSRQDSFLHVVSSVVANRIINADDFNVSIRPLAQAILSYSAMIGVGAAGAMIAVSDLMNPHEGFVGEWVENDLDNVASNNGLVSIVRNGNLLNADIGVWITYDIVALTDSERIEILGRCECPIIAE